MTTAYLGPSYNLEANSINNELSKHPGSFEIVDTPDICDAASQLIADGAIIGWVQGRSEFGPRALGNRSILADPRAPKIPELINAKVKQREAFMPFAPSILAEHTQDYFCDVESSPFMLLAPKVKPQKIQEIPAVTHVDGTSRLQTVIREDNAVFYDLIKAFYVKTGIPILLNTSLNSKDQPICETVSDALQCLTQTNLDFLVIGSSIVKVHRAC